MLVGTLGNSSFVLGQSQSSASPNSLEHNSVAPAISQAQRMYNKYSQAASSFDNSAFSNETQIQVTREVTVNNWGFTQILDHVSFSSNETSLSEFTYFVTTDFYKKIQYLETTPDDNKTNLASKAVVESNGMTQIRFSIDELPKDGSINNFTITTGVVDLVSTNKASLSEKPDTLPLKLSGFNFFPLFDFPMTSFEFSMGIDSTDGTKSVNSTNFLPAENTFGFTSSLTSDGNKALRSYSKMTTLSGFNYTSLTQYPKKENNEYIPGYSSTTKDVLTVPAAFDYSTQFAPMEYTNFEVTTTIDEWGHVQNHERITLKHNGVSGQTFDGKSGSSAFFIYINAPDILSLDVTDGFTNITVNQPSTHIEKSSWDGGLGTDTKINGTQLTITPRSKINAGSSYTFELTYEIPVESRLNETSGFLSPEWDVMMPLSSLFYWPVRNFDLTVIFPNWASTSFPDDMWGMSVTSANMTSVTGFLGITQPALRIHTTKVSYFQNHVETFKMSLPLIIGPFWDFFQYAIFFAVLLILIVLVRIGTQTYSSTVVTSSTGEQIPFDLIKDFVINYEEKTALRTRLTELEKRRKNLRKVEYTKLYQTLLNKQNGNDRALVKVNSQLVKSGPRYRDAIRSIELAEAEREQALDSIADLEKRRKQSRIRPEIYNKLKDEQGKRLRKANSTIERVLVELRSLLTERAG